jgi:hypothetical protein
LIDRYAAVKLSPIEEEMSFDENNQNYISKKNNSRQPLAALTSGDANPFSQLIEIDRQKIFKEELDKI